MHRSNLVVLAVVSSTTFFGCTSEPEKVLRQYSEPGNCSSRAAFVLSPTENGPRMTEYYKDKRECGSNVSKVDVTDCKNIAVGEYCNGDVDGKPYCLTKTTDGFKIDWLCSVGWNSASTNTLTTQPPTKPVRLRVKAQLSDGYAAVSDKEHYYSITLGTDGEPQPIQTYLSRKAPDASKLYEVIKDGKKHPVMVAVVATGRARRMPMIITRFLQSGWHQLPVEVGAADPVEAAAQKAADELLARSKEWDKCCAALKAAADKAKKGAPEDLGYVGAATACAFCVDAKLEGSADAKEPKATSAEILRSLAPKAPLPDECK